MLKNNLITKIALGVAIAALIFSIVTLIRVLVTGSGILFAVIQVVGTIIIVVICVMMLKYMRNNDDGDDEDEEEQPQEEEIAESASAEDESIPQDSEEQLPSNDKYDLTKFK